MKNDGGLQQLPGHTETVDTEISSKSKITLFF